MRSASTVPSCAARSSPKAAISAAPSAGGSSIALRGGLINTDAIDNSAGVDCSDHEVNIKIALDAVVKDGELTPKQRDKVLAEMTDEVAALVLRDNTFQNQVLLYSRSRSAALLDEQGRYMRHLSSRGRLNRRIEFLPNDEALQERRKAGAGLTSPELAVLLAYNKMELYDEVLASDVPEDPYIATTLERYFPQLLRERFPQAIQRHPLRREIIATHVVNSMVNRVGPTFVHRLHEETGAGVGRHRPGLYRHAAAVRAGRAVARQRGARSPGAGVCAARDRGCDRAPDRAWHRLAAAAACGAARPRPDDRPVQAGTRRGARRTRAVADT